MAARQESQRQRVLVLGGDGFCGWPTALHLSDAGHDVTVIDNLSRRKIDVELGVESLTPIRSFAARVARWNSIADNRINRLELDLVTEFDRLQALIDAVKPHSIIHFAEQRAAPYSMKTTKAKRYTIDNNTSATHNLLCAIVASDCDPHLIHLGTMGVYGYDGAGLTLPEGYLRVHVPREGGVPVKRDILYPANPGSVYHLTKTLDQLLFQFYAKNDRLRITDLHQGIVWGTETAETVAHPDLINRFDYDGDYGTVLNRFLMQAAAGHPLTVHGTGGQTRAFIHIRDTVACLRLAMENPPAADGKVRIANQVTETHRVRDLAKLVADIAGATVSFVPNPRKEAAENELNVANDTLIRLGLKPTTLAKGLMQDSLAIARRYADRHDPALVPCTSYWTEAQASAEHSRVADTKGPSDDFLDLNPAAHPADAAVA